jgi:uncharacterized membrane protein YeaQ/YmgE (transglycosylase-associated protein family)
MSVVLWIVVGLIAGWLASVVMRGGYGLIGDIVIGVVGALLGGFIASSLLHIANPLSGFNLETIGVAFLGSVLVIIILRLISSRGYRV